MDEGVGPTLREARKRRKVELSEVEATTKIRRAYLEAIESGDWEGLPGDAYARGFVRTYAAFLGLDGARLASEVPARPTPDAPGGGEGRRRPRRAPVAVVCAGLVAAIVVVGLLWNAGGGGEEPIAPTPVAPSSAVPSVGHAPKRNSGVMALSLRTKAELWVCLLDADGRPLVDGIVLPAGAEEGPFRSGSFTVSFGNGEVEMRIDGRDTEIPESASPLGYEIGRGGELAELGEAERPTCT